MFNLKRNLELNRISLGRSVKLEFNVSRYTVHPENNNGLGDRHLFGGRKHDTGKLDDDLEKIGD